jgi:O-antigen ligase
MFTLFITLSTLGQLFYPIKETSSDHFAAKQHIIKEGLAQFQEKPIWGWGQHSFKTLLAFSTDSKNISGSSSNEPESNIITALVERGIIGIVVWFIVPIILMFKLIYHNILRPFSIMLLTASASAIIISFYDSPFSSSAFTISFWIILIAAFGWSINVNPDAGRKKGINSDSIEIDELSPYENLTLGYNKQTETPNRFL